MVKNKMQKKVLLLFFFSGFAALMYQIVWQRVLFTAFGTNIEAITIIVSVFMFGLGVGSLLGGYLSKIYNNKLLQLFVFFETAIGLFGIVSLPLIKEVNRITLHFPDAALPLVIFSILIIPTLAMGATLPILVAYLYKRSGSIGGTVSRLYYINTLGSAISCLVTAGIVFVFLSLSTATYIAASINIIIAIIAYRYIKSNRVTV